MINDDHQTRITGDTTTDRSNAVQERRLLTTTNQRQSRSTLRGQYVKIRGYDLMVECSQTCLVPRLRPSSASETKPPSLACESCLHNMQEPPTISLLERSWVLNRKNSIHQKTHIGLIPLFTPKAILSLGDIQALDVRIINSAVKSDEALKPLSADVSSSLGSRERGWDGSIIGFRF